MQAAAESSASPGRSDGVSSRVPPVVRVDGLSHAYARRTVLEAVGFEVSSGEVFGLLGPNGSGKSTALGILAGTLPLQTGGVEVTGRSVGAHSRWLRSRVGVVFQEPALDPLLSADENLVLAARLRGYSRSEARRRADLGLARSGLSERRREAVSSFSGGMRRRLDLARALLHDPQLLLMDEPTSGLDEASFRATWRIINGMRAQRQVTVVVATHRAEEAERCDRLAVLVEGRLALVDTPEGLRNRVQGDVIVIAGDDPEALAAVLRDEFGLDPVIDGSHVVTDCVRGHELIPALVDRISSHRLRSVSLRRPTLADAFLKVTGRSLDLETVKTADREAA